MREVAICRSVGLSVWVSDSDTLNRSPEGDSDSLALSDELLREVVVAADVGEALLAALV